MAVNKRKRSVRLRGSRTHGWGTKKHRGSGNRGGKGNAGAGKRAKQKKISTLQEFGNAYFGKYGFKTHHKQRVRAINISELFRFNKKQIDLSNEGYDKLLGGGNVEIPYQVTVKAASKKAVEKIEGAGGSVALPTKKRE